ncbi:DUF2851 family protein [Pedobacter sp. ASV1-7]|uniref:DUF2851 family protein n=1 Tax=Pedobacter sp. ASV1-7 TaxID=3145237 RepID=UPI0032E8B6D2
MDFNEDFLHFIWKYRLFNSAKLVCKGGEELQVLNPGILNRNAGPDFSDAKLIIDQTVWVGHVEIHVKSSDWLLHGHQNNAFYDAVILHVVYEHDSPIYRTDGSLVPVLVIEGLFLDRVLDNYKRLIANANHFPCERHISSLDQIHIYSFFSRIVIERFEQKAEEVFEKLNNNRGDWEQLFYCFLARNFGFKVNAVPFELLSIVTPLHILSKHKNNALQIEALLFGQAGFLEQEFFENYPLQLQREYLFLKKKYRLIPMNAAVWKFLRMRPQNFPTIRIAQFAALIVKSSQLFSKMLKKDTLSDLYTIFNDLPVNEYWLTHYHFNKTTNRVIVQPGKGSVDNIIINTVCLFLFCYGKYTDQSELSDRASDFLERIPSECNAIVNQYSSAGIDVPNALTSQALLQLNKYYCNEKKCLNCTLGLKILKK